MPYRAAGLLMALGGLVAVVGLILIGVDVHAAKQRGPRWKRRLLGAGLAVLGIWGAWFSASRPGSPFKPDVMCCYAPIPMEVGCAGNLRERLPLLEKLIAEAKLDPGVARTALAAAEMDLGRISMHPCSGPGMSAEEMTAIRDLARPIVERLRARLGEPVSLEEAPEWKALTGQWDDAAAALAVEPGAPAFDSQTQQRLADALERLLHADLPRLLGAGLLSEPEARLLELDLVRLSGAVRRARVSDRETTPTVASSGLPVPPAGESARDIGLRAESLKKILASGVAHPAALRRILASVRKDLEVLDRPASYDLMGATERAKAEQIRDAVKAEVEKLKNLLGPAPEDKRD